MSVLGIELIDNKQTLIGYSDGLHCKGDLITSLDGSKIFNGYANKEDYKTQYVIGGIGYVDTIRQFIEFFKNNILSSDGISDLFNKFYEYSKTYNHLDDGIINSNFVIYWKDKIYKYEDGTLDECRDRAIIGHPCFIYSNQDKTLEEIINIHKKNLINCGGSTIYYSYSLGEPIWLDMSKFVKNFNKGSDKQNTKKKKKKYAK